MTLRSIRRAQERKTRKEQARQAKNFAALEPSALEPSTLSQAQLEANRANAQLSTGPKSPEGKTKVSLNAVKTALTGRTVLLPGDDAAEYQRHIQAFAADYAPVGPRECELVQSIADTWWRLQRIPCLESALLAKGYVEAADSFDHHDPSVLIPLIQAEAFLKYEKQIRNLQLQEARLFRRYEKERAELVALQQARQATAAAEPPEPSHPELGFEFSTTKFESENYLTAAMPASPQNLLAETRL